MIPTKSDASKFDLAAFLVSPIRRAQLEGGTIRSVCWIALLRLGHELIEAPIDFEACLHGLSGFPMVDFANGRAWR
jgi:hypothetical protein